MSQNGNGDSLREMQPLIRSISEDLNRRLVDRETRLNIYRLKQESDDLDRKVSAAEKIMGIYFEGYIGRPVKSYDAKANGTLTGVKETDASGAYSVFLGCKELGVESKAIYKRKCEIPRALSWAYADIIKGELLFGDSLESHATSILRNEKINLE